MTNKSFQGAFFGIVGTLVLTLMSVGIASLLQAKSSPLELFTGLIVVWSLILGVLSFLFWSSSW
jgi:hypothetical protein